MGRLFFYSEHNGMGRNGTKRNNTRKKEQEWNDLAEGPRSGMERNNLKKVGMCPALV